MYFLCTQLTPHRKHFNLLRRALNNIVPADRDTKDHYKRQYIFHISPNVCCKLQMEAYSSIYAMQPTEYVLVIRVGWRETYSPAYIHLLSRCIEPVRSRLRWGDAHTLSELRIKVSVFIQCVCTGNWPITCMHFFFFKIIIIIINNNLFILFKTCILYPVTVFSFFNH